MTSQSRRRGKNGSMPHGMMICCVLMLLTLAGWFVAGGTVSGLDGNLGVIAPLALCGAMHLVLHRFMGRSCHSGHGAHAHGAPAERRDAPDGAGRPDAAPAKAGTAPA